MLRAAWPTRCRSACGFVKRQALTSRRSASDRDGVAIEHERVTAMTKATELREMSDEQLELTLKEADREPVSPADPSADRAARRAQRAAQAAPADRPIKTIQTERTEAAAAKNAARNDQKLQEQADRMPKNDSHRRRDQRQDEQDAAASRFRGWCSTPSTARFCAARRSATSTTRTNESHVGDTVEIVECRAALEAQALGAGAGRRRKSRSRSTSRPCGPPPKLSEAESERRRSDEHTTSHEPVATSRKPNSRNQSGGEP